MSSTNVALPGSTSGGFDFVPPVLQALLA